MASRRKSRRLDGVPDKRTGAVETEGTESDTAPAEWGPSHAEVIAYLARPGPDFGYWIARSWTLADAVLLVHGHDPRALRRSALSAIRGDSDYLAPLTPDGNASRATALQPLGSPLVMPLLLGQADVPTVDDLAANARRVGFEGSEAELEEWAARTHVRGVQSRSEIASLVEAALSEADSIGRLFNAGLEEIQAGSLRPDRSPPDASLHREREWRFRPETFLVWAADRGVHIPAALRSPRTDEARDVGAARRRGPEPCWEARIDALIALAAVALAHPDCLRSVKTSAFTRESLSQGLAQAQEDWSIEGASPHTVRDYLTRVVELIKEIER